MKIIPHPHFFLNQAEDRERASEELKAIISSNPGTVFNLYSFWYRQTRVPAVRAALESFFKAVIAGDH